MEQLEDPKYSRLFIVQCHSIFYYTILMLVKPVYGNAGVIYQMEKKYKEANAK